MVAHPLGLFFLGGAFGLLLGLLGGMALAVRFKMRW